MKKILLLIALALSISYALISCKETVQQESTVYEPKVEKIETKQLYNIGDVVYTKPDSVKGVVIETYLDCSEPYLRLVSTYREERTTEDVYLTSIYGKE